MWWGAGPQQVLTWAILEAFVIVSDLVVLESLTSVCSRPGLVLGQCFAWLSHCTLCEVPLLWQGLDSD